jgi:hypothetical protein
MTEEQTIRERLGEESRRETDTPAQNGDCKFIVDRVGVYCG